MRIVFLLLFLIAVTFCEASNRICDSARGHFNLRDDVEIICSDNSTSTFENAWLNWNWGTDTPDH